MKIIEFHKRESWNIISLDNFKNYEIHKTLRESFENHEQHTIQQEKHENHEIIKIPSDNYEKQ